MLVAPLLAGSLALCLGCEKAVSQPFFADAGVVSDAGTGGAGGAVERPGGYLYVSSFAQGPAQVTAVSGEMWPDVPSLTCAPMTVDGCVLSACGGLPDGPGSVSAGDLHVTGGAFPLDVAPAASGDRVTYGDSREMALFHGGERLVLAADGDRVPAFSVSLVAPSPVMVIAPSTKSIALTAGRLDVAWTGGAAGEVVIQLSSAGMIAICPFGADLGGGSVTAAVLSALSRGPATVVVTERSSARVAAGVYSLDVQVLSATPSYSGTLTLD